MRRLLIVVFGLQPVKRGQNGVCDGKRTAIATTAVQGRAEVTTISITATQERLPSGVFLRTAECFPFQYLQLHP